MPSLKDLRVRIRSVQSTQKITSAMKMVAASRLRRAQEQAEAARPYAQRMERVLASLAGRMAGMAGAPPLLAGTGKDDTHLIVVASSDRGLAGGFNASILREARRRIRELDNAGKRELATTTRWVSSLPVPAKSGGAPAMPAMRPASEPSTRSIRCA